MTYVMSQATMEWVIDMLGSGYSLKYIQDCPGWKVFVEEHEGYFVGDTLYL